MAQPLRRPRVPAMAWLPRASALNSWRNLRRADASRRRCSLKDPPSFPAPPMVGRPGNRPRKSSIPAPMPRRSTILEGGCLLLGHEEFDILAQRALIAFQRKNVIGLLVDDLLSDIALATHRIDGHDRPFDRQHLQELGDGDDLVGLLRHLDLAEYEALTCCEG